MHLCVLQGKHYTAELAHPLADLLEQIHVVSRLNKILVVHCLVKVHS